MFSFNSKCRALVIQVKRDKGDCTKEEVPTSAESRASMIVWIKLGAGIWMQCRR